MTSHYGQGLDYLHNSPIAFHGRLFVNNCVVDARWIVKLTDFGLNPILNHMKEQNSIELPEEEEEVDSKAFSHTNISLLYVVNI